jgi:hypothetical protein
MTTLDFLIGENPCKSVANKVSRPRLRRRAGRRALAHKERGLRIICRRAAGRRTRSGGHRPASHDDAIAQRPLRGRGSIRSTRQVSRQSQHSAGRWVGNVQGHCPRHRPVRGGRHRRRAVHRLLIISRNKTTALIEERKTGDVEWFAGLPGRIGHGKVHHKIHLAGGSGASGKRGFPVAVRRCRNVIARSVVPASAHRQLHRQRR